MATLILDSYKFVRTLTDAGISEEQAKAIAEGVRQLNVKQVATKQDVQVEIHRLKADLLKWLIPVLLGQVAVFALVVQWLA